MPAIVPPSGLMVPYWNVVKEAQATAVVVMDDPINILNRIVFYADDSRPIQKVLSSVELEHYLVEVERDARYYARSYAKAHIAVHIQGSPADEAARKVKYAQDPTRSCGV